MEFNTNIKIPDFNEYIGIIPLVILSFGGLFVSISLAQGGFFCRKV